MSYWRGDFCVRHTVLGPALVLFIVFTVSSVGMPWTAPLDFASYAYQLPSPIRDILWYSSFFFDCDCGLESWEYPYWSYLTRPTPGGTYRRKAISGMESSLPYSNAYSRAHADGASRADLDLTCWEPCPSADHLVSMTGLAMETPSAIPAGLTAKMFLAAGPDERMSAVVYGPESADYGSLETFADVMDSYGIMVLYKTEGCHPDVDTWYWTALGDERDILDVVVGGVLAKGVHGIPDRGMPAGLVLRAGGVQVFLLSVAHQLPVLSKIASAMV